MTDERRFTDEEVAQILDEAAEASASGGALSSGAAGLTLRELQDIAREVGIPEEAVSRAATRLDSPAPVTMPEQRFLGQTVGVGRAVELPRRLTDEEWHRLVVDLRQTFDAKGRISGEGAFRQWTNSNLQVFLEPSGNGERLRLRTLKGNARAFQGMGAGFMASSVGLGVMNLLGMARDPSDIVVFAGIGVGFFFASRLSVPNWARTRARQFEEVIARVQHDVATTDLGRGPDSAGRLSAPGDPDPA